MATIGLSLRSYVETKDDEVEVTHDETDVDVAAVGFALVDSVGYLAAEVVGVGAAELVDVMDYCNLLPSHDNQGQELDLKHSQQ